MPAREIGGASSSRRARQLFIRRDDYPVSPRIRGHERSQSVRARRGDVGVLSFPVGAGRSHDLPGVCLDGARRPDQAQPPRRSARLAWLSGADPPRPCAPLRDVWRRGLRGASGARLRGLWLGLRRRYDGAAAYLLAAPVRHPRPSAMARAGLAVLAPLVAILRRHSRQAPHAYIRRRRVRHLVVL